MKRFFKWLGLALLALIGVTFGPILYVEFACRGEPLAQVEPTYITAPEDRRPEARTYMVYPEWHIVYAYEGYAETLRTDPPHGFGYVSAIRGFWSSACGVKAKADELGEAGFNSKATIYTIGASFTLEMLAKAAYEETLGRIFRLFGTSPQDAVEAEMAADYAQFLQQVPWYKYDFDGWTAKLWEAPVEGVRSWERRLSLGGEWKAKAAYARVIAQAVAAVGADELSMKIAVEDIDETWLASQPDVQVLSSDPLVAQVPRYRVFTTLARNITAANGNILEIAGNDDILVSYLGETPPELTETAQIISDTPRASFRETRYLIATKVSDLTALIKILNDQRGGLEHIYDY